MTKKTILQNTLAGLILICLTAGAAFAQTTAFTYQGKLTNAGTAATAIYDMQFRLFDNPNAGQGNQQGATLTNAGVQATEGNFTVALDFGAAVFASGANLYLEISVRTAGSSGGYTGLAPRQRITSAPYAIRSLSSLSSEQLGGIAANSYLRTNGDGAALTNLNAANIASGTLDDARLSPNAAKLDASQTFTGVNTFNGLTLDGESQIIAPRLENSATDPAPAAPSNAGRIYFNTTSNRVMVSDGTSWQGLSPNPRQTFVTPVTSTQVVSCSGGTLRSASFTKNSAGRLRITYTDTPTALSTNAFGLRLNGRIDGNIITSPARFGILSDAHANFPNGSFAVENTTTIVGYVSGVAAGTHTLSFTYETMNNPAPVTCYSGVNFPSSSMIEIEEVP